MTWHLVRRLWAFTKLVEDAGDEVVGMDIAIENPSNLVANALKMQVIV